jgi:hypothetical protein
MEFLSVCYPQREVAFIRTSGCGIAIDFVLNTDHTIANIENNFQTVRWDTQENLHHSHILRKGENDKQ